MRTRKLCTSKRLLCVSWGATSLLTLVVILGVFCSERDMTPIATLAGLAWGATATDMAFYSWKAKSENKIKLTKQMADDWAKEYGIEAVVSLAQVTLSD